MVGGTSAGSEKDPGFLASLGMTKERVQKNSRVLSAPDEVIVRYLPDAAAFSTAVFWTRLW